MIGSSSKKPELLAFVFSEFESSLETRLLTDGTGATCEDDEGKFCPFIVGFAGWNGDCSRPPDELGGWSVVTLLLRAGGAGPGAVDDG